MADKKTAGKKVKKKTATDEIARQIHEASKQDKAEKEKEKKEIRTTPEELLTAVNNLNHGDAGKLLERGADANFKDASGRSILMTACERSGGNIEMIKLLVESGAEVNARDNERKTAFLYACASGNTEAVKFLWEKGALLSVFNKAGANATILAAMRGNAEMMAFLIEKKLNVNAQDNGGMTPLMYSAASKNKALVDLLLSKKADAKLKDARGMTALDHANAAGAGPEIIGALSGAINA